MKSHFGKESLICPNIFVHNTKLEKVTCDPYLGDLLSADGKNRENIKKRKGKGMGVVSSTVVLLNEMMLGNHFKIDKKIEAGYDGQHSLIGTPRQSHYCGKVLCWAWLGTVQQKDYCWM